MGFGSANNIGTTSRIYPMKSLRLSLLSGALMLCGIALAQSGPVRFVPVIKEVPTPMLSAVPTGQKNLSDHLHVTVRLDYRDPAGIQAFANAVSDPKSPEYRHFITPEEVGRRFGPLPSSVQNVANYLT